MPSREPPDLDWPFDDWLKLAVGQFGLTPKEFWETGFCDWRRLIEHASKPALTRSDFDTLLKNFPDEVTRHDENIINKETDRNG